MEIQDLKQSDVSSLNDLQPSGWKDILSIFDFYSKSSFCFPIKVTINNKIVGIGTRVIHNDIAWLAHIIVNIDYRNKGIGKLITQTLINSLKKECTTIYLIATDLGAPLYEKIGFKKETDYLFFKDINTKWEISKNIKLYKESMKDTITNLDQKVSGERRMFHIEKHLQSSYIFKKDNIVEGFYLPSFGEGMIIADTSPAGIELMKLRLLTKERATFPSDNLTATNFLHRNNYIVHKTAMRMRLGKKRNVLFSKIFNRIGGHIG